MRFLLLALLLPALTWAAPCVTPVASCTEWFEAGPGRVLLYRSHALSGRNESIVNAIVVIHGRQRDADNYYRDGLAAAFLADALERTLVIAPRFASKVGNCHDDLAPNELGWACSRVKRWASGGEAIGHGEITSFDVMDALLRRLADRKTFPALRNIVLVGHSAGGQYVTRYAMANRIHEKLGVALRYVVANPSSYTYPESDRPVAPAGECKGYDDWPYGFQRRVGYAAKLEDVELRRQLSSRPVTYLLGELDILPLYSFDSSCAAMAQGATRLARGQAYHRFVTGKLGATHAAVVVPACGHNARCMFSAEIALPLLFPKD